VRGDFREIVRIAQKALEVVVEDHVLPQDREKRHAVDDGPDPDRQYPPIASVPAKAAARIRDLAVRVIEQDDVDGG
jgi:hypothetical protein